MIGCLVLKFGPHQQHGGLGTGFPRVIFALSDTSATKETGVCTEGSKLKVSHHEVSPLLAMSRVRPPGGYRPKADMQLTAGRWQVLTLSGHAEHSDPKTHSGASEQRRSRSVTDIERVARLTFPTN